MKKDYGFGLINRMSFLSKIFLLLVICAMIISPKLMKQMDYDIYLFSDSAEMQEFKELLEEKDITYKEMSDSRIGVRDKWKEETKKIYQEYFESEAGASEE